MKTIAKTLFILIWPLMVQAQWQHIAALPSRPVVDLVLHENRLYALTDSNLIYHSPNGIDQWKIWSVGPPETALTQLIFKGDDIYVGSLNEGIYRSRDAGQSWQYTGLIHSAVYDMAIKGDTLYAATEFGPAIFNEHRDSWSLMDRGLPPYSRNVEQIEASRHSLLITAGANGTFYRFDFKTKEWIEEYYYGQLGPGLQIQQLVSSGDTLYAVNGIRVIRSNDDGGHWTDDKIGTQNGYSRLLAHGASNSYLITNLNDGYAWLETRPVQASPGTPWDEDDEFLSGGYIFDMIEWGHRRFLARTDGLLTDGLISSPDPVDPPHVSWEVFPNPVSSEGARVISDESIEAYQIYNSAGELIREKTARTGSFQIFLPDIPGNYFLRLIWPSGHSAIARLIRN